MFYEFLVRVPALVVATKKFDVLPGMLSKICRKNKSARRENRTPKILQSVDFESTASKFPSAGDSFFVFHRGISNGHLAKVTETLL